MPSFKTTYHFEVTARIEHPEANRDDWIEHVLANPIEQPGQDPLHPGRRRYYGYMEEAGRYMRVIVMPDGAVHTAFFDRNFARRRRGQ